MPTPSHLKIPLVYIIEDEAPLRTALSDALQHAFALVQSAATGAEARVLFDKYQADLVILDLMLPDEDGVTLLEAARGLPGYADTPFLICSNLMLPEVVAACNQYPPVAFYEKVNMQLSQVVSVVQDLVERFPRRPV